VKYCLNFVEGNVSNFFLCTLGRRFANSPQQYQIINNKVAKSTHTPTNGDKHTGQRKCRAGNTGFVEGERESR